MTVFVVRGDWKQIVVPANFIAHADMILETDEEVIVKNRHGDAKKFDAVGLRAVLRILSNGEEIPLPDDVRAKEMLEGNDGR